MSTEHRFANSSGSLNIYTSEQHIHLECGGEFGSCNLIGARFSDVSWTGLIGYCLKSEQNAFLALLCLHSEVLLAYLPHAEGRKKDPTDSNT